MTAILLAFAASVSWGAADYVGGVESRKLSPHTVVALTHGLGGVLLGIVVIAFGAGELSHRLTVVALLAGLAQGLGLAFYYQALTVGAMGVVAPITASAALIPVVFGIASGERPAALQGVGIALTLVGIVLASRSTEGAEDAEDGGPPRGRLALGASFALCASVCIGLFLAGLGEASEHGSVVWAVLLSRITSVLVLVVSATGARGWVAVPSKHSAALTFVGVLSIAAVLLFAQATTLGLVSVVAVIGALYPVTTALLASLVLHERVGWVQRTGTVLALAGVAAIVAG